MEARLVAGRALGWVYRQKARVLQQSHSAGQRQVAKNPFLQSVTPTFTTVRADLGTFRGKAT